MVISQIFPKLWEIEQIRTSFILFFVCDWALLPRWKLMSDFFEKRLSLMANPKCGLEGKKLLVIFNQEL